MKRKLIFVILVAMILAPMSAYAASLHLDYDRVANKVTVTGSDFGENEAVAILSTFTTSPPAFDIADGIDQVVADSDGNFTCVIPTAGELSYDSTYYVLAGSSTIAPKPIIKAVKIGGTTAILQAPLRYNISMSADGLNGVKDIDAEYPGAYTVTSTNPLVLKVVSPTSGNPLNGITVQGLKVGSAILMVQAGDQVAAISVTVTY